MSTETRRKSSFGRMIEGTSVDEQMQIESGGISAGAARYRRLADEAIGRGDGASLKAAEWLVIHWFDALAAVIKDEQRAVHRNEPGKGRMVYGPMLVRIPADQAAMITLHTVVGSLMRSVSGERVTKLCHHVGRNVAAQLNAKNLTAKDIAELERKVRRLNPCKLNWWASKIGKADDFGMKARLGLGHALIEMLRGVATMKRHDDEFVPGVESFIRTEHKPRYRTISMLRLSHDAGRAIEHAHGIRELLRPVFPPMVVRPLPWLNDERAEGGYYQIRTPLLSKGVGEQKEAVAQADCEPVLAAIDNLGATPWRINKQLLAVMQRVWATGGGVAGIPGAEDTPLPPRLPKDTPADELKAHKRQRAEIYSANIRARTDRFVFLSKLAVADEFADDDRIYFPHQMDFRGRVYPLPQPLNHQGDDVCRALLEFADPVEPSEDWIYIHVANCYGVDKISYADRVRWAKSWWKENQVHRWIYTCDGIIENEKLWGAADKPWQFLASLLALADPDAAPHLPVQLDGSCNGLQHYAAMGRDTGGAVAVNMVPHDTPSDVYSAVLRRVEDTVGADVAAGVPEAIQSQGAIDRDLVKQPVMTQVYGVTYVGARTQIKRKLLDKGFSLKECGPLTKYLVVKVFDGIGEVCSGADSIMAWIRECADAISNAGHTVAWLTPMGFPVVQPYRQPSAIRLSYGKIRLRMSAHNEAGPVLKRKQKTGAAPNFVHSMDAAHMMMTANECASEGIDFAGVHDAYWFHAGNADRGSAILREQFVELYQTDRLEWLRHQWQQRYPGVRIPAPPATGDYDVRSVLDSMYFFS